jgi:hypothetical protein
MTESRPDRELYLPCSRCTWHARHVQREDPTQRGMLTGVRLEKQPEAYGWGYDQAGIRYRRTTGLSEVR